jgi:hypothetical protein
MGLRGLELVAKTKHRKAGDDQADAERSLEKNAREEGRGQAGKTVTGFGILAVNAWRSMP